MRISDWSSDVCSSDLNWAGVAARRVGRGRPAPFLQPIEQDRMSYQQPAPDTENAASEPKRGARGRQRGEGRQRDVTKLMTAAREKYETGRLKGAIGLFKRALNGDRGNAAAMAWLSLCYMRQRRFAEGEKLMNRALETAPMSAEVQTVYAKLLHGLGRMDGAVNAYSQIGRATCRGIVCQYVKITVCAVSLKNKTTKCQQIETT